MTAAVVPHSLDEGGADYARGDVVIGGDIGW
jgi:hypothetical protein